MGREIRRVPPNWEHPYRDSSKPPYRQGKDNGYQPMYDQTFEAAAAEWKKEFVAWEAGARPNYCSDDSRALEYWEYNSNPPEREYYRPWKDEEATWFQVWETVSEGTPVTPPFATKQELIDYLVAKGDFWDQERGDGGWERANAEQFVERGWAMSMMVQKSSEGTKIFTPRDGMPA